MLDDLGGSAQGNLNANASVSADGSVNADASATSSLGAGGPLGAALSGAASLGASAAAGAGASASAGGASLGAGLTGQLSFGAAAAGPGDHLPDPWLIFRFIVDIQPGIGRLRFQKVSGFKASMQPAPPPTHPAHAPAPATPAGKSIAVGAAAASSTQVAAAPTPGLDVTSAGSGAQTVLPGPWKWDPITLTRGMADDGEALWDWLREVVGPVNPKGVPKSKRVTIMMVDNQKNPLMTITINKAYPTEWGLPTLDATTSANAIETLKLTSLDGDVSWSIK